MTTFKRTAILLAAVLLLPFTMAHDEHHEIRFQAVFGNEIARCGFEYSGVGAQASTVTIQDLRLYLSNVRVLTDTGAEVQLILEEDSWQHDGVVLLDFEDASGACSSAGNSAINTSIRAQQPQGQAFTGIAFDVGVPFEWNHVDTSTAPSPLNLTPMFWGWQFGFKFIKVELQSLDGHDGPSFWPVHIGSTGCESPAAVIAPEVPCANPNVMNVRLEGIDPFSSIIQFDLSALFANVDVSQSLELAPPGCMSGTLDPDCDNLFVNLGLDLNTGQVRGDSIVFSVAGDETREPSAVLVSELPASGDDGHGHGDDAGTEHGHGH